MIEIFCEFGCNKGQTHRNMRTQSLESKVNLYYDSSTAILYVNVAVFLCLKRYLSFRKEKEL